MRIDAKIGAQALTSSDDAGNILIFDSTQAKTSGSWSAPWRDSSSAFEYDEEFYHMRGFGFEPNKSVMKKVIVKSSILSPKFDERQSEDKVRIHSFDTTRNINMSKIAQKTPKYTKINI